MTLEEAIESFLEERRKLGFSGLKTHRWALKRLLLEPAQKRRGSSKKEVLAAELVREDLDALLDEGLRRGHAPATRFASFTIARRLCEWLVRRGVLLVDPSRTLAMRKPRPRVGFVPGPQQVRHLLHVASPREALLREQLLEEPEKVEPKTSALYERRRERVLCEALRDYAILEILYGSGLRITELRSLDTRDVDLGERTLFIRSGKGKKDRVVPLTRLSVAALSRYLVEGRPGLLSQRSAPPSWRVRRCKDPLALFLTVTGKRFGKDWPFRVLEPLSRLAGLPKGFSPHRLRHACAVHLLDAGASVVTISRLLGHASLQATQLYLHLTTAQLEKALLRAHPRENERERT